MSDDFDKRLSESLKSVTGALRDERAARTPRALGDFWRRYRRRRVTRFTSLAVAVGATAVVAAFAATQGADLFKRGPAPATFVPAPPPGVAIRVPPVPVGVSVDPQGIWVASESGWLTELDPDSNRALRRVPVGGTLSDIALTPGAVWYADSDAGAVRPIDDATGHFAGEPVSVGTQAHIDVDIGPQGTVWAVSHDSGALVGIDAKTNQVIRRLFVTAPVELGVGPGVMWALADDGATLARFSFAGADTPELQVPVDDSAKTDLAATATSVFVAEAGGRVVAFDAESGEVRTTIDAVGTNPELAVGQNALWIVSDRGDGDASLQQIDVETLKPMQDPVKFLGTPTDVALGNGSVWVTDTSRDAVVRLKTSR